MSHHIWGIDHSTLGALDFDRLAYGERCHVFGDVTGGVRLNEEIEVAWLVVARNWGVGADDLFGCAFRLRKSGCDRDVLSDRESENMMRLWELEAVATFVNAVPGPLMNASTYTATLCEMIVFSVSSKSCSTAGLRTFTAPVSLLITKLRVLAHDAALTGREVQLHAKDGSNQQRKTIVASIYSNGREEKTWDVSLRHDRARQPFVPSSRHFGEKVLRQTGAWRGTLVFEGMGAVCSEQKRRR